VATAISTELQIEPLLEKIVTVTTEILHADRSTLFLHDKRTDELWSRVAEGMNSREIRFPASAGLAGSCFTTGETINIPNAYKDPRFNQEVDLKTGYKTRNILCVPITSRQGGSLGVMQVLNHEKGPFRTVDEERLRAFAAQASVALENAQLFSDVQNARNYNESILQSLSNAVVTLDEDGHVEKINEAAERVLGMDHRAVGEKIDRWITDANPWIAASVQRAQDGRSSDSAVDQVMVRPDGDKVSINLTTVPLVDVQEKHLGTMLVAEDITEEKRLRGTMARYMTKEVMDKLLEAGEEALGGTAQEVAILFSDIVGFTPLSESLGARETVIMLNEYFSKMVDVVFQHGGVLDKYIGDAIMALFGAPFHNDNDADNALTVGNEMMAALRVLNSGREQRGQQLIRIGVGLSCGEVIAGNIGSPRRMDYTVIGDNVNLAARLESANRFYGTGILLCQQLVDKLTGSHKLREVDCVRVKGQVRPVVVFEALGHHTPETFPNMDRALLHFEQGMKLYKKWEWRQSAESFGEVLQLHPGDELSAFYQKQCNLFQATPPPPEWDGVRDFLVK
ncbi:MAG: GAF domain-containing protein, partial [Lentisphaeria bacterium]|nr:GAF domain-containing protein [Lentisphaeria bacterium]